MLRALRYGGRTPPVLRAQRGEQGPRPQPLWLVPIPGAAEPSAHGKQHRGSRGPSAPSEADGDAKQGRSSAPPRPPPRASAPRPAAPPPAPPLPPDPSAPPPGPPLLWSHSLTKREGTATPYVTSYRSKANSQKPCGDRDLTGEGGSLLGESIFYSLSLNRTGFSHFKAGMRRPRPPCSPGARQQASPTGSGPQAATPWRLREGVIWQGCSRDGEGESPTSGPLSGQDPPPALFGILGSGGAPGQAPALAGALEGRLLRRGLSLATGLWPRQRGPRLTSCSDWGRRRRQT